VIAVRLIRTLSVFAACTLALSSIAFAAAGAEKTNIKTKDKEQHKQGEVGLYVEYTGGLSIVRNQNLTSKPFAGVSGHMELAPGWNAGAAFGAKFQKYFRGEVQISYRNTQVKRLPVPTTIPAPVPSGVGATTAEGNLGLFAAMANGYVDLDLLGIGVYPYLGLGIGYGVAVIQAKNQASALKVNDHDSVFVYNLMAGGTYRVNDAIDLSLGYRYVATTDPNYSSRVRNLSKAKLDSEYDAHEVTLGLRFNF
jgi:opacity protein-like surface antigen